MKEEAWIWTELLAFDNSLSDCGVESYLKRTGFIPDGISLLVSHIDFVMLHRGMKDEYELFPDICSRRGHEGNEERKRQKWTNYQLRELVRHLQQHSVKVFFSFFIVLQRNTFHNEWALEHPEILIRSAGHGNCEAVNLLGRLDDGTFFEDIFVEKLQKVVVDYGFNGWHGADSQGPGCSLCSGDASDEFIFQFAEYFGKDRIDKKYLQAMNTSVPKLTERLQYIWHNFNREWADFTSQRWVTFWDKATKAMHALNKETMLNSPNTKSIFESIFYFGLDYRKIAEIGVDYLLVESVATSIMLIEGGYERLFDYCAALAELKASLPGMKLINLIGVKDVVESYDSLRHAPSRLERDFYALANQTILKNDSLERCGNGYMVCLGDGITQNEWDFLNNLHKISYSFDPAESGELVWLSESEIFDTLRDDHQKHGTWPPYLQVSYLVEKHALDISCVCTREAIDTLKRPLLVTNFDLRDDELQGKLLTSRHELVVLLGNFHDKMIPTDASGVFCRLGDKHNMGCVVLNRKNATEQIQLPDVENTPAFDCSEYKKVVENRCPLITIPEVFWNEAGRLIRASLGESRLRNSQDGTLMMSMKDSQSVERIALLSNIQNYATAKYHFETSPEYLEKISPFPYSPLEVREQLLTCKDARSPLHVPPFGIIVFDSVACKKSKQK